MFVGAALVVALAAVGVAAPERFSAFSADALEWVLVNFAWLFVLAGVAFVAFAVLLGATKYGRIRLGADDDRPAFSTVSWIAMMFSAGMGIGLMFFGVSEPATHHGRRRSVSRNPGHLLPPLCPCSTPTSTGRSPPGRSTAWSGSRSATRPCARDGPTSSAPRCTRCSASASTDPSGKTIDIVAIWATLFGTATSLGWRSHPDEQRHGLPLGHAGERHDPGHDHRRPHPPLHPVGHVRSEKGVQFLSNVNMVIAVAIAIFVFLLGPIVFIVSGFVEGTGNYLFQFVPMSFRTGVAEERVAQRLDHPVLGVVDLLDAVRGNLPRAHLRGRTIREYMLGVLLVPSAVSMVWFAIFGGAGIDAQRTGRPT